MGRGGYGSKGVSRPGLWRHLGVGPGRCSLAQSGAHPHQTHRLGRIHSLGSWAEDRRPHVVSDMRSARHQHLSPPRPACLGEHLGRLSMSVRYSEL